MGSLTVGPLMLTADELDALARRLGAVRFPGVTESLFDTIDRRHHDLLADRLLAGLTARGLIAGDGPRVLARPEVATLLAPTLRGSIWYGVERTEPGLRFTTAVGEFERAVVWHRAEGPYHRFDLVGTDGDVANALADLIDASAGAPVAGSAFRARHSRLAAAGEGPDLVPGAFAAVGDGWRATTTVTQAGATATPSVSWLSIIDGGPGRVWMVEPDPDDAVLSADDPACRVTPVDPAGLRRHLTAWSGCVLSAAAAAPRG